MRPPHAVELQRLGIMNNLPRYLHLALTLMLPGAALAQDVWRSPDGSALAETPARKAKNGFGVSLVITPDPDWQAKWDTPSHVTPRFTEAKEVSTGGRLTILTFVVNPKTDANGQARVVSRIRVTRPNGTKSIDEPDMRCLAGSLAGLSTNVRLCEDRKSVV